MDPNGQLMDIGTVAAANIARALDMHERHVPKIKKAIRDEVSAMSTHFTLAFADISTAHEMSEAALKQQYDNAVAEVKSTYRWMWAHQVEVCCATILIFALGVALGLLI